MKQVMYEFKKKFTDDLEGHVTILSTQPNKVTINITFIKTLDTELIFNYLEKNKHLVAGIATFTHEDDGSIIFSTEVSIVNTASIIKRFIDSINYIIKVSYDNILNDNAFIDAIADEIQNYAGEQND